MRVPLLLVVVLGLTAPLQAEHVHEDERLRITGDVPEAWITTAADLGNALYPELKKHFGREPKPAELPLQLVLYPDRDAFAEGMQAAGHRDPAQEESGGFTDGVKGTSRVWLQADAFHTRRLILHELVHQFHDKCQDSAHRGKGPFWYREGIAEWFGWHRRTKAGVRFGAIDVIARGGARGDARKRMKKGIYPAWDLAVGKRKADSGDALCLVGAFLGTKDKDVRSRFRTWEADLLQHGGGSKSFERAFESMKGDVASAVRVFWQSAPLPWATSSGGWDERDGVVSAKTAGEATAWSSELRWKAFSVTTVLEKGRAGLCSKPAYRSPQVAAVVEKGSMLLLAKPSKARSWKVITSGSLKTEGELRLSLAFKDGGKTVFTVVGPGGRRTLEVETKTLGVQYSLELGCPGLIVRKGTAQFRDFRVDERY